MKIPERLVEIREKYGYTRKRLSDELDKPYATITKYENGEREVNLEYLVEIAKKFNVTTDYLLGVETAKSLASTNTGTREPTKEELIAALILLHVIQSPIEPLSDADMRFLTNIVALLNDWFGQRETPAKPLQFAEIYSHT